MSNIFFISIQGSYNQLEIALFQNSNCLKKVIYSKSRASSHLIPLLNEQLLLQALSIKDLQFIAIDQGPGAFTSLRVAIATVNGIAFNHSIPIIGVNGLEALYFLSHATLTLLNAYNNDVYYYFDKQMGCKNIDVLCEQIKSSQEIITATGNGVLLHQEKLSLNLGSRFTLSNPYHDVCPAEYIGQLAYDHWLKQENISYELAPIYLKTQLFAVKK